MISATIILDCVTNYNSCSAWIAFYVVYSSHFVEWYIDIAWQLAKFTVLKMSKVVAHLVNILNTVEPMIC